MDLINSAGFDRNVKIYWDSTLSHLSDSKDIWKVTSQLTFFPGLQKITVVVFLAILVTSVVKFLTDVLGSVGQKFFANKKLGESFYLFTDILKGEQISCHRRITL